MKCYVVVKVEWLASTTRGISMVGPVFRDYIDAKKYVDDSKDSQLSILEKSLY